MCTRCGLIIHEADECILPAEYDFLPKRGDRINVEIDVVTSMGHNRRSGEGSSNTRKHHGYDGNYWAMQLVPVTEAYRQEQAVEGFGVMEVQAGMEELNFMETPVVDGATDMNVGPSYVCIILLLRWWFSHEWNWCVDNGKRIMVYGLEELGLCNVGHVVVDFVSRPGGLMDQGINTVDRYFDQKEQSLLEQKEHWCPLRWSDDGKGIHAMVFSL